MNHFALKLTLGLSLFLAASSPVFAGSYDIKTMTPEIQQALSGRQSRYAELQKLKSAGAVGENQKGYVEALKDSSEASAVVSQENEDRRAIYRGIVSQNQLGPQGMSEVEKAFAEVQRDKARPGDFIQSPAGQWSQK